MNNVYVLLRTEDYEGSEVLGVFDSDISAEKGKAKYLKRNTLSCIESLEIEEFKLNKLQE